MLRGGISRILTGSLIGQGVLLAVSPLLTRLYQPTDFAALTVFTALATVTGSLITLSWDRAIVIPRSEIQALSVATLGLITVVALGIGLTIAAYLVGPTIDEVFGTRVFAPLWWLLPSTVVAMGIYSLLSSWLVRLKHYGRIAARNALQGVTQAISSVVLGLAGAGVFGLVSGMGVGRAVSLVGVMPWATFRGPHRQSWVRISATARRFRRFPLVATWSRAFNVVGLQLPPVLIVAIYGTWEAGLYALTVRVLATPVGIVTDAVSHYFEGIFAERVRMRSRRLRSVILMISGRLLLLSIVPAFVIAIFGPAMFAFVFGEEWRLAGTFAQLVVALYVAQFVVSPISRALLVLERQFAQLAWDIARMILTTFAVVFPMLVGATLGLALALLACTQVLLYGGLLILCLRAARRAEFLGVRNG